MSTAAKGMFSNVLLVALGAIVAYGFFLWRRGEEPVPVAEAPRPHAIAAGSDGTIYVGRGASIEAKGETWSVRAPVQALAVDEQGRLFVAYRTPCRLYKFLGGIRDIPILPDFAAIGSC